MNNRPFRHDREPDEAEDINIRRRRMIRELRKSSDPTSYELALRMAEFWNFADEVEPWEIEDLRQRDRFQRDSERSGRSGRHQCT